MNAYRKGAKGERKIEKLLKRAGWRAGAQCGSGSYGGRIGSISQQGDLWARCGDTRVRIEVKHHKHEPRALQSLRGGSDILAYVCSTTGRTALFIDESLFWDLMAWSAEAMEGGVQERRYEQVRGARPRFI